MRSCSDLFVKYSYNRLYNTLYLFVIITVLKHKHCTYNFSIFNVTHNNNYYLLVIGS